MGRLVLVWVCRVRPQIPVLKDVQPLLEMDRDERKLDVFLTFHRSSLLVSDMKVFLPFTINLDPYIKKRIKEEQQSLEEDANMYKNIPHWHQPLGDHSISGRNYRQSKFVRTPSLQNQSMSPVPPPNWPVPGYPWQQPMWIPPYINPQMEILSKPLFASTTLSVWNARLIFIFIVNEDHKISFFRLKFWIRDYKISRLMEFAI